MRASTSPPSRGARAVAPTVLALGALALPLLLYGSLCVGDSALRLSPGEVAQALGRLVRGGGSALQDTLVELRLWKALTTAGVGAALGLSGALVQGLFRNPLASPSVLGISSGASLGAVLGVVLLGRAPSHGLLLPGGMDAGWLVPLFAFAGALAAGAFVFRIATRAGRVSIPALLLMGLALNTILGGLMQWIQAAVLDDNYLSKSILSWSFGTLHDRTAPHALLVWSSFALALAALPWISYELDLMQTGLEDAEALGVDTVRVRWIALLSATLAAAGAVAVAGQVAFVGLIVPHVARFAIGASHRVLLLGSALFGALLLVAVELFQCLLLGERTLPPGVLLSLIGGPFFLLLVWTRRRELALW